MKIINIRLKIQGANCDLKTRFNVSDESNLDLKNCSLQKSDIFVRGNSKLILGTNCEIINSKIFIDRESSLILGDDCRIKNSSVVVNHKSELVLQNYSLVESENQCHESLISIEKGSANLGFNSNIKGRIIVNDGILKIGSNTFVNHGAEIRCEEKVEIGDYVFISYYVDIFDTNTHSLDWRDRKQEVVDGFPNRTNRTYKPLTQGIFIGDYVWIGKFASILKGCEIGSRSIVGTKAVVTKSFPEDSLIVGNPSFLVKKI